jgi:hypothetical protein
MFKDTNKATILFSAIFLILGYLLGSDANCEATCMATCERVCASEYEKCCAPKPVCSHGSWVSDDDGDGVQVIVAKILDEKFEGDTTFAVPGGEAVVHVEGGEVTVEVNVEEIHEAHEH